MQSKEQRGGLASKFEGFGVVPSDALWGNIAEEIEEKEKRRGFFWWWIGGGLAAIILVGAIVYNPNENKPTSNNQLATFLEDDSDENPINGADADLINNSVLSDVDQVESTQIQTNYTFGSDKQQKNLPESDRLVKDEKNLETEFEKVVSEDSRDLKPKRNTLHTTLVNPLESPITQKINLNLGQADALKCFKEREKLRRPWEFGVKVAYYKSFNTKFTQAEPLNNAVADLGVEEEYITGSNFAVSESFGPTTINDFDGTVSKNINFDFTAGKYVSHRWMLNTGLNFSRTSYATAYVNLPIVPTEIKISSLGIPLGASLDIIKKKKFKLRVAAALNNDFALLEKLEVVPLSPSESSTRSWISGYSASADVSLGVLFKIRPRIQLSVSPTYRWYFTQNIKAQNLLIRQDNWLGGSLGVVWTL